MSHKNKLILARLITTAILGSVFFLVLRISNIYIRWLIALLDLSFVALLAVNTIRQVK